MGRLILRVNLHDDTVDPLLDAVERSPESAADLVASDEYRAAAGYIAQRLVDARRAIDEREKP